MTASPPRKPRHLSLLEVAIVLIIIASLSLFAIPKLQSRQMLTHEGRAQALLREIHAAEQQFFLANEGRTFGFLTELLGNDTRTDVRVKPRMLAASGLRSSGYAHLKDGYLFTVYLPGRGVAGVTHDNYANADFDKLARGFVAYAWPVMAGYSGRAAYAIDETGVLRQYRNDREPPFSGITAPPPANAATSRESAFTGGPPPPKGVKFEPVVK